MDSALGDACQEIAKTEASRKSRFDYELAILGRQAHFSTSAETNSSANPRGMRTPRLFPHFWTRVCRAGVRLYEMHTSPRRQLLRHHLFNRQSWVCLVQDSGKTGRRIHPWAGPPIHGWNRLLNRPGGSVAGAAAALMDRRGGTGIE
jgi:hypothetical protein